MYNVVGSGALWGPLNPVRYGVQRAYPHPASGFCGALTTYSTFGYETVTLYRSGARTLAALYVAASVLAGFGAAYCGMAIAQAIV